MGRRLGSLMRCAQRLRDSSRVKEVGAPFHTGAGLACSSSKQSSTLNKYNALSACFSASAERVL